MECILWCCRLNLVYVLSFQNLIEGLILNGMHFLVLQIKPGLSAYAQDPQQAAESLVSLLDKAESVVPREFRPMAPVRVGVCYLFSFIH